MKPERERQIPSPFEKLRDMFNKMPEKKDDDSEGGKSRHIKLADGTVVDIFMETEALKDARYRDIAYHIFVETLNESMGEGFKFVCDEDGLLSIKYPELVFRAGDMVITKDDSKYLLPDRKQDKMVLAETLVNWVDKMVIDNKYTHPPIEVSFQ